MVESFEDAEIDQEEEQIEQKGEIINLKQSLGEKNIIQLKDNVLPKGLVPLERLFDSNDFVVNSKKIHQEGEMEDCNLGTHQEPNMVRLSKGVVKYYKEKYIDLFKKYMDVFSWTY